MKKGIILLSYAALILVGIIFFRKNIYYIGFIVPALLFISGCAAYSVRYEIGSAFGFQSGISGKNIDTWEFANTYSGKLLMKVSTVVLAVVELLIFILQPDARTAELMILPAVASVFFVWVKTEKELNKIFDWQGNRRELLNTKEE